MCIPHFCVLSDSGHQSSSSSLGAVAMGVSEARLLPPGTVDMAFSLLSARTSLIRPEDSAIRRRSAFSSAPDTLARCFFRGLPMKESADASPANEEAGSTGLAGVDFGGVVDRPSLAGGVLPDADAEDSGSGALALATGSAEC